jgi:uroporphyrinogen decarboxylase
MELGGVGHILTPGCVVRYPLDKETLSYIRQVKEEIEETLQSSTP